MLAGRTLYIWNADMDNDGSRRNDGLKELTVPLTCGPPAFASVQEMQPGILYAIACDANGSLIFWPDVMGASSEVSSCTYRHMVPSTSMATFHGKNIPASWSGCRHSTLTTELPASELARGAALDRTTQTGPMQTPQTLN